MYRALFAKTLSTMLIIVFPMASFAADTRAMLLPQGGVTVNGTMLARSTVLVTGDRVITADNATGTITSPGNTINLVSKSSAIYDGGTFEITQGGAAVVTTSGTVGKVLNITITPANDKATYEFGQRGNKVMIAALEGKLRISDGQQQMMLDSGKAIEISSDAAQDKDKQGGGAGPGARVGVAVPNAKAILIGAVAVGLGVGLTYGLIQALTPATASPTR